jgi:hypothetical protein
VIIQVGFGKAGLERLDGITGRVLDQDLSAPD